MPRHTHDDLLRALGRSDLAPVYYLHGTEDVLKEEATHAIVDQALAPHERDFNLDQRSAGQLDPETLHSLVNTLPMLAARRAVVIRDIETWKKKAAQREVLTRYLANPSPDTVLVLVEGAPNEDKQRDYAPDAEIAGRAYAVDFAPLEPARVARWIGFHAKRLGVTFGPGAAEHLASSAGYELGLLRAELEKLSSLDDAGPVSRERVGELVGVHHGETLEDWVEATIGDDGPRALLLTRRVLDQGGMSGVKMITALGSALIGVRMARAHYDKGSRGGTLERVLFDRLRQVRPFGLGDWKLATRNWSRWAETWPAPRTRTAIRATLETDTALKGTRVSDEAGVVVGLVLQLVSIHPVAQDVHRSAATAGARGRITRSLA